MRRRSDHPGEQPQEVKRAEAGLPSNLFQIERLLRVSVDPKSRVHCAGAISPAVDDVLSNISIQHVANGLVWPLQTTEVTEVIRLTNQFSNK